MSRSILRRCVAHPIRYSQIAWRTVAYWASLRAKPEFAGRPVLLFERPAGIGDIICTFPAALELRKRYADAVFVYCTRKAFTGVVEMGQVADLVVDWDRSWMPRLVDKYYHPQNEEERPSGRPFLHLVDDFARSLEVELSSRQPRLHVPDRLSQSLHERIMPFARRGSHILGIHVGPTWRVKEWTVEGWTRLVALLQERTDCVVIQLGADVDTAKGFVMSPRIPGTEDWVGKLSLEETIAALQHLDLLVGVDSGLLHAAGAVGTPTVGLFGAVDPGLPLPPETPSIGVVADVPCLGCHQRLPRLHWRDGCPNHIQCMSELTPENVLNACARILDTLQSENKNLSRWVREQR